MKLISKPYNLLLLAVLGCLIISIFSGPNTLDFHIHDTVFVIAGLHVFIALSLLLLVLWLIYILSGKVLFSKALTWIHVVITLAFVFFIPLLIYWAEPPYNRGINNYDWTIFQRQQQLNIYLGVFILFFLLSQILFLFNILAGLIKYITKKQ